MSTKLRTTIAGSLPKPSWLAEPEALWAAWKLDGDALAEAKRDAVRLVLRDQEQAGIDVVSDGEQTRRHFVTTFIEALDGVDFEHRRTVRIRNRYDAAVPVVVDAVARRRPVFVDDAAFLRLTRRQFHAPARAVELIAANAASLNCALLESDDNFPTHNRLPEARFEIVDNQRLLGSEFERVAGIQIVHERDAGVFRRLFDDGHRFGRQAVWGQLCRDRDGAHRGNQDSAEA